MSPRVYPRVFVVLYLLRSVPQVAGHLLSRGVCPLSLGRSHSSHVVTAATGKVSPSERQRAKSLQLLIPLMHGSCVNRRHRDRIPNPGYAPDSPKDSAFLVSGKTSGCSLRTNVAVVGRCRIRPKRGAGVGDGNTRLFKNKKLLIASAILFFLVKTARFRNTKSCSFTPSTWFKSLDIPTGLMRGDLSFAGDATTAEKPPYSRMRKLLRPVPDFSKV